MSASTAIGMVSESLRNLLVGEMQLKPDVDVTILAPDESAKARRINLFLYKVQENPTLKNMDWKVKPDDPTQLVSPPLSLNLFYLLTQVVVSSQLVVGLLETEEAGGTGHHQIQSFLFRQGQIPGRQGQGKLVVGTVP